MSKGNRQKKIIKTLAIVFNVANLRRFGKILLYFVIAFVVAVAFFYAVFILPMHYMELFPTSVHTDLAIEMLKVLIEVNGILIGLNGLVFAQMLYGIHSQRNVLIREEYEAANLIMRTSAHNRAEELNSKRRSLIIKFLLVTMVFLSSILLSLTRIAWLQFYLEKEIGASVSYTMNFPVLLFIWAIVSFIVMVIT